MLGEGSVQLQPESHLGNDGDPQGDDPGGAGKGRTEGQDWSDLSGESGWP